MLCRCQIQRCLYRMKCDLHRFTVYFITLRLVILQSLVYVHSIQAIIDWRAEAYSLLAGIVLVDYKHFSSTQAHRLVLKKPPVRIIRWVQQRLRCPAKIMQEIYRRIWNTVRQKNIFKSLNTGTYILQNKWLYPWCKCRKDSIKPGPRTDKA